MGYAHARALPEDRAIPHEGFGPSAWRPPQTGHRGACSIRSGQSATKVIFNLRELIVGVGVFDQVTRHELVEQLAQRHSETLRRVFLEDGVGLLDQGPGVRLKAVVLIFLFHGVTRPPSPSSSVRASAYRRAA